MTNNITELLCPQRARNEIYFIFYNYENINNLIEERRDIIMRRINGSTSAWLKGINQDSNSFEDIIIRLDEDRAIKRFKHWNSFLTSFFNILKIYERPVYYKFIELKYFKKLENEEIMKILNVDEHLLKEIKDKVIWLTYKYAVKDELYKMEV